MKAGKHRRKAEGVSDLFAGAFFGLSLMFLLVRWVQYAPDLFN